MNVRSVATLVSTLATVALAATMLAPAGPAAGVDNDRTGVLDRRGFPRQYTDDSGMSLQPCEDGSLACHGAVRGDLVPPEGEALYWSASATLPSRRGELSVEFALEAAFGENGRPVVFDRLRIRGHLIRAGRYVLRHPYGSTRFRAASPREQRNVDVTVDIGCSRRRGGPCNGRIDNWLRSRSAPLGYVGAGEVPTRVTGGTARNRLVLRAPRRGVLGRTSTFEVLGQLAPGPGAALSKTSVYLGNAARPRERTMFVRNIGRRQRLSLRRVRVRGARTVHIRRRVSTCRASPRLAPGRACRIVLRYRPDGRRSSRARLVIRDNTRAGVHRVPLRARTAPEIATRRRMHFTPHRVGSRSVPRRVVVRNTGAAPMRVRAVSLRGRHHDAFVRAAGAGRRCARGVRVRPGRACRVYVRFAPHARGRKRAVLRVRSTAFDGPARVRLDARARRARRGR